jgi:hypothetical protein
MLGFEYDDKDTDVSFGSSPPNRPFVVEGSDLFKAVMEDLHQDSRLTREVVDDVSTPSTDKTRCEEVRNIGNNYLCKQCLSNTKLCSCYRKDGSQCTNNRVQWIDELYDKPIAVEKTISDFPQEGPIEPKTCFEKNVKPILKHKATCIIIFSE